MDTYSNGIMASYLIKSQLHDAINYLSRFSEKKELYETYVNVFQNGQYYKRTDNKVIEEVDKIYQEYYRNIFWNKISNEDAEKKLFKALWSLCGSKNEFPMDEQIESEVGKLIKAEGYEFLGGRTQGYYGSYIWKSSTHLTYDVELPSGLEPYSVIMMDGFVASSWLNFISFGISGVGGWASDDGTLCCVKSAYDIKSDLFNLSFLKHEAQHAYDKRTYSNMNSIDLEYRAKLVELIYWPNDEKLMDFLREADNSNPDNSHSVASYKIISEISQAIFNSDFIDDEKEWSKKTACVAHHAKELLSKSNEALKDALVFNDSKTK